MEWKRLLAYISGSIDEELQLRNEYLVTENRILRNQLKGRPRLTDGERRTLAEIGKKLSKMALEEVTSIVKPETNLAWHRRLVAKKFDGSKNRKYPGRPRIDEEVEELIIRLAKENRSWGYDRIAGALKSVGHKVSDQTVGNVLKRRGLPPGPERKKTTTWKEFHPLAHGCPRVHRLLHDGGVDEVRPGHVLHPVLHARCDEEGSRRWVDSVSGRGVDARQIARNVTMADVGFLSDVQHLIHDRDGKFCRAFIETVESVGVKSVRLPAKSPNLNAFAERWVRSVKGECLSKLILFGEESLRRALAQYVDHHHGERPHQGKGNVILFPSETDEVSEGSVRCRERLGGLLKYYYREAG